jgi:MFS family permease
VSQVPDPATDLSDAADVPLPTPSAILAADRSFIGHAVTQFLGAFNDNVFKQILLLLFVAVPTAAGVRDLQAVATVCFAVPFILFSGLAGFLSDRYSKRRVIICSKIAEIVIMGIGAVLFSVYARTGLTFSTVAMLSATLFLMGAQSAFFGPGKYGILPEMLDRRVIPAANGFVLMLTFLAIIFGIACAGELLHRLENQLWIAGVICVGIGIVGTYYATRLKRVPPAFPQLRLELHHLGIGREVRNYLATDRPLVAAIFASTLFWLAASMVIMTVNAFGVEQLEISKRLTAWLNASVSIGIAVGSLVAGTISKGRFHTGVMKAGAWGLAITLLIMAVPGWNGRPHMLGLYPSIVALIMIGAFTGMFAVPLQVFIQIRPPDEIRGRMLATQNLLNWIGIVFSAVIYEVARRGIQAAYQWGLAIEDAADIPSRPSLVFAITALIMGSVAVFYRPKDSDVGDNVSTTKNS